MRPRSRAFFAVMAFLWTRNSQKSVGFSILFISLTSTTQQTLTGASICRLYEKSADDLMYKIQSINFTPVASRSGFIPVTMDTVSEARKQFQQELRAKENPNTRKAITQLGGTLMTAQIDRSKLPKQFSSRPTTLIKEEESSSIMAHSTVNVSFVGPRNDPEARRTRACEFEVKLLATKQSKHPRPLHV